MLPLAELLCFRLVAPHDQRVKAAFADNRHFLWAAKGIDFFYPLLVIV